MNGNYNFCFKLRYLFSKPERHHVVAIRLAGERIMLLKRVIAMEGELVEFQNGILYVNKKKIEEQYVRYQSNWDLPPRKVDKGHVYVVGDNRSVPIDAHQFGQTLIDRIIGAPLW